MNTQRRKRPVVFLVAALGIALVGVGLAGWRSQWFGLAGGAEGGPAAAGQAEDQHRGEESHSEAEGPRVIQLSDEQLATHGIELAEAGAGVLDIELTLPGEVKLNADRVAHVVPRMAGVVREVRKRIGDTVQGGEVLAVLDSQELADAKAALLASFERVGLAEAGAAREERLWRRGISAEQEYLEAKQRLAEFQIELRAARQKLYALGFTETELDAVRSQPDATLTRYAVRAPFAGTVIAKEVSPGEAVAADADIFVIADLRTVWVDFSAPQQDLALIRPGTTVTVTAGHGIPDTEAVVAYVEPVVQESTRMALARVIISNAGGQMRPGVFVTGRVAVRQYEVAVAVPNTAIQTLDKGEVVFMRTPEGFIPQPVTTGRSDRRLVEITSGLAPGATYVRVGALTLKAELSKSALDHGH